MAANYDKFLDRCSIKILCHEDDIAPAGNIFFQVATSPCYSRVGDDRLWFLLETYTDGSLLFVLADEYFSFFYPNTQKTIN